MNNDEEGSTKINDQLLFLQSRLQKDITKKNKEIKINILKPRHENEIVAILQILPENRTIIQKQKLQNHFRYTPFFQKLLKKNSIEKVSNLIEKLADRVQYRYINSGDIVYKYMEKADSIYFILTGEASVLIPKKYEQMEDEKMNKIQFQKIQNNSYSNGNYSNQRQQQQYLPTIKSIGSNNQLGNMSINLNQGYNQGDDFRIKSLLDIPLDSSFAKDSKRIGSNLNSSHQLSPVRSSRLKRGAFLANQQQYFFQDVVDNSPVKSIDNIRKLNSMSLIQEFEVNKTRSINLSPRKQPSSYNNSPEKNVFSSAITRALLSPEKVKPTFTIQELIEHKQEESIINVEVVNSENLSTDKQNIVNTEQSPKSLSSEESQKNQNLLGIKLLKTTQSKELENLQSYFHHQVQGGSDPAERLISSFSQIPMDENDIISEKSEVDSLIGDSNNRTPLNFVKAESKKLSNIEKMFMSEPEFQMCFGSLYPHEINNCALYYFDGNTFKYNFGQRLKENQNTDTVDIIQKQPRSTTCVALTSLQLAQLDKNDYNDILKDLEELNLWRRVDQICKSFDTEKIPNLKKMIADIFPFLQKVVYSRGQLIFQEGEYSKGCYIIKKGEIELTKWSMIDPPQEFQNENQFRNWQSFCYPQEISLSLITAGQFFGEEDMLRNRKVRTFNAKCKSSECTVYFISKIHFLRILYESNIVVDIFIKRAKLKTKWHREKYDEMTQILLEDYTKRLGRNLFEEKRKEILGKKGREEIEKEKKEYNQMTGMFRDTYEKMVWKMSVADELNFPFKQNPNVQLAESNALQQQQQSDKTETKNTQIDILKSRSSSIDSQYFTSTNKQGSNSKQYGRLIIKKGSKQTFLEEKMSILANLQDRQMRQLASKQQYLSQKTLENAVNQTNLVRKSFQNQQTNLNHSNYNSLQQQKIENVSLTPYVHTFSKQYAKWKNRSHSVDKPKIAPEDSKKNVESFKNKTEEKQQSNEQDDTPLSQDTNIPNLEQNPISKESVFKQQANKQQNQQNKSEQIKVILQDKQSQKINAIQSKSKSNLDQQQVINTGQSQINQNTNNANSASKGKEEEEQLTDEQKLQMEEQQKLLLATLTCKIQGFSEDLQTKMKQKRSKTKENNQEEEEKKLPVDFRIKTARTQAEAITSHFMNIMKDGEVKQTKKKGKKVKRNKLDIIEYRLKGQVWAIMQMKRELAKFEIKKQLTLKNEKSKAVIRSLSSPHTQQQQRDNGAGLSDYKKVVKKQDSQFLNIFGKIKNQIIEIQQDKFNENNVYIPAFSVFPYANNAEYILSHPLLNTQADNTNLAFKQTEQDTAQQVKTEQFSREKPQHKKTQSLTENNLQRRKQKVSEDQLDEVMLSQWNQVLENVQQKDHLQDNELNMHDDSFHDKSHPQPWFPETLQKQNSIQALETYVESQKFLNFNSSSDGEDQQNSNEKNEKKMKLQKSQMQSEKQFKQPNYNSQGGAALQTSNSFKKCYLNTSFYKSNQFTKQNDGNSKNIESRDIFRQNNLKSQEKNQQEKIVNYHIQQVNRNRSNKSLNSEKQPTSQGSLISNNTIYRKRILSSQNLPSQLINQSEKLENSKELLSKGENTNFNSVIKAEQNIEQKDYSSIEELNKSNINAMQIVGYVPSRNQALSETKNTFKLDLNNIDKIVGTSLKIQNKSGDILNKIDQKVHEISSRENHHIMKNTSFITTENSKASNFRNQSSFRSGKTATQKNIGNNSINSEVIDSQALKLFNESHLSYLKKVNVQNKPKSLVITNHQGKPITYSFK